MMLTLSALVLAGFAGVSRANTAPDSCVEDILKHVPHLKAAYQYLDLEEGSAFTLFAPSEGGAAKLTKLFLHEGCDRISKIRLGDLASAGLLNGVSVDFTKLSEVPIRYDARTSDGKHSLEFMRLDDVDQITVFSGDGAATDVIEVLEPTAIDVCDSGRLYVVDDMIVPPSLRERIQDVLDNVADGCAADVAGPTDASEPLAEGAGLLTGANVDLSTENVDAKFPIEARLDTLAVDSEGNVIPLASDIELDVETTLQDIRRFQSNQVFVQVPITVNVTVDAGDDCRLDGATLDIPIDVKVGAELVVEGQSVGFGTENVIFGTCDVDEVKLWKVCAGVDFPSGSNAGPRFFQKHCTDGICVQKNHFFAQCLPKEHRKVFKWEQGWTGKRLECKD